MVNEMQIWLKESITEFSNFTIMYLVNQQEEKVLNFFP